MPTFTHGRLSSFAITDSGSVSRDISNVLDQVALEQAIELADVTAFGANDHAYIAGLGDTDIPIAGMLDSTTFGYLWGIRRVLSTFIYGPQGTTAGLLKFTGSCLVASLKITGAVADKVSVDGSIKVSAGVTQSTF